MEAAQEQLPERPAVEICADGGCRPQRRGHASGGEGRNPHLRRHLMRLWSLHPSLLDSAGLVALWRETLLAQKVLQGKTKGYKFHPQLDRFKKCADPVSAIALYLVAIHDESVRRGYSFDKSKISTVKTKIKIPVRAGQIDYEFAHLKRKLKLRDPACLKKIRSIQDIPLHPL